MGGLLFVYNFVGNQLCENQMFSPLFLQLFWNQKDLHK